MPKRLIDYDALWCSGRLEKCTQKARVDYLWIYGIADAGGSFEMTSTRAIWAKVSTIRPELTLSRLKLSLKQFEKNGLLFKWSEKGRIFGHWVGSLKEGRLPSPSTKARYYLACPYPPTKELEDYNSRFIHESSHDLPHDKVLVLVEDLEGKGLGRGIGFGGVAASPQGTAAKPAAALSAIATEIPTQLQQQRQVLVLCERCGKKYNQFEYVMHSCVAR